MTVAVPDQNAQAGGVDELHAIQIDGDIPRVGGPRGGQLLLEQRRTGQVDLALHVEGQAVAPPDYVDVESRPQAVAGIR